MIYVHWSQYQYHDLIAQYSSPIHKPQQSNNTRVVIGFTTVVVSPIHKDDKPHWWRRTEANSFTHKRKGTSSKIIVLSKLFWRKLY